MPRTRLTRHELKSRDEITTKLENFTEIAISRKKEILLGIAALVVIVLGYVGWTLYTGRRTLAAQNQLAAVIEAHSGATFTSDKERYEKTIVEAQKTVDEYGSLPAALIAKYYLALGKEGLGDTAGAVPILEEVVAQGDPTTRAVAQFALGGIYHKHGESQKAIDTLKQLNDSGGYSSSAVVFELGKVHEANKQPEEARTYYEKIVKEYADSPFRPDAEAALRRMGFAVPSAPAAPTPS